mmetsp:Transcript_115787/g.332659  ORF Transcript_115787/g.332659 Transcript_115787/m.332659 type:complete len:321 (-) Transcript_115787:38-1000(-)
MDRRASSADGSLLPLGGDRGGVGGSGASWRLVVAVGSAAVAGAGVLYCLLARWRRPSVGKEEALLALERMKCECAAVYTQVVVGVARAGPLPEKATSLPSAPKPKDDAGGESGAAGPPEDEGTTTLRQAIDQPLVLTDALKEAAARSLAGVPGADASAEGMEQILVDFQDDPEVQAALADVRAMHEACLEGKHDLFVASPSLDSLVGQWEADEALEMLRELGSAKAAALRSALAAAPPGVAVGSVALRTCTSAEDSVWERRWPNDTVRRSTFEAALARLEAKDGRFRDRRAAVERELEQLAAPHAAGAAHHVWPSARVTC